ncbi:MAG TPA: DNA polymerase III subunit chi [Herbaspirillum sp.]|jgi:DNA polymerase-3 subunit chi|nr:DNA polymerase III subunit chi [Herbaspirillum sp.]
MTRIDFHSNVADRLAYTCRLVRKARAAQCRIVLLSSDAQQQAALDEALWTFSATDFLPHVAASHPHAADTPVILITDDQAELPHHHVLINLSGQTPAHFARFERMFEIISAQEEDKIAGRDRYRYYKDRGYPLTHFVAQAV